MSACAGLPTAAFRRPLPRDRKLLGQREVLAGLRGFYAEPRAGQPVRVAEGAAGRVRDPEPLSSQTLRHVSIEPSQSCEGRRRRPRAALGLPPARLLTAPCHSDGPPLPTRTVPFLSWSLGGAETALFVVFCVKCTLYDL